MLHKSMAITKRHVVELARAGLLKDAELTSDLSFTLETSLPGFFGVWTKHTISQKDEPYELLLYLTDLRKPGEVIDMFDLTDDKTSRLYAIPKELYDETN